MSRVFAWVELWARLRICFGGRVNLVLGEEPKITGMPKDADPNRRSVFTLVPSAEYAERCYDKAKLGELSEDLWVD